MKRDNKGKFLRTNFLKQKKIICACGCKQEFDYLDKDQRPRKFIHGHNSKTKEHIKRFKEMRKKITWNKGIKNPFTKETLLKMSESHKGKNLREKNPFWKGGIKRNGNYREILIAPCTYMLEHRFVMQKHLGRKLTNEERVHHLDGNPLNNSIENLLLLENESEHQKLHYRERNNLGQFEKEVKA